MKEIIENKLIKLRKPLNEDWIFNFHNLIDTYHKQPLILKFIKEFQENKQKDYEPLLKLLDQIILLSLDFDEAGKKKYSFWMKLYPNIRPWPSPQAKSLGDAIQFFELDVVGWVKVGLTNIS